MNALELADELTATVGKSGESTYAISAQAAAMLRKQDAAIKTLREALAIARDYFEEMGVRHRLQDNALAATEEFK